NVAQPTAIVKNKMSVPAMARPIGDAGVSRISSAAGKNSNSAPRLCGAAHSRGRERPASRFASADFMEACLQPVERRVAAGFVNELLMVAVFDDATALDGDDAIGVANGRQPLGDDYHGPPLRNLLHVLVNDPLALIVERARRLVEDEDARIADQRPGDSDALALAARQACPALADDGVVAERKLEDEVVRPPQLRRGDHPLHGGGRVGERDGVADRATGQDVFLQTEPTCRRGQAETVADLRGVGGDAVSNAVTIF